MKIFFLKVTCAIVLCFGIACPIGMIAASCTPQQIKTIERAVFSAAQVVCMSNNLDALSIQELEKVCQIEAALAPYIEEYLTAERSNRARLAGACNTTDAGSDAAVVKDASRD